MIRGSVKEQSDRASITVPLKVNLGIWPDSYAPPKAKEELLPQAATGSLAIFNPRSEGDVTVFPTDRVLAKEAVERALRYLKCEQYGGELRIITKGGLSRGLGTSTADIIASIRAVMNSLDHSLDQELIGEFAARTEGASDGVMFDEATLFVTTRGKVLENFRKVCPPIEILGFDADSGGDGIKTLELPPRNYSQNDQERLSDLRQSARRALSQGDVTLLGRIATASAKINQQFSEKPLLDETIKLCNEFGGAGIIIAHSGTMMGIMFHPASFPSGNELKLLLQQVESLGSFDVKHYSTGPD